MTRTLAATLLSLFLAATAFAHAGHVHNFLGTVKDVRGNDLTIVSTASKEVHFVLTTTTAYRRGEQIASATDLVSGTRVAVHVADDGHTATLIKIGSAK